jgi:hypothetical protein
MTAVALIAALATFVLGLGLTLLSPLCLPCVAVVAGLLVGYFGANADKPPYSRLVNGPSAISGLFAGLGLLLGQMAGSAINATLVGAQGVGDILSQMGFETGPSVEAGYYGGIIGSICCIGLINLALSAGFGVIGGQLWWQVTGKALPPPSSPFV